MSRASPPGSCLPASGSERSRGQVLAASGPRRPPKGAKAGLGSRLPKGRAPGAGMGCATSRGGVTVTSDPNRARGRKDPWRTGRTPCHWLEWQNTVSLAQVAAWKLPEGAGLRRGQRLTPFPTYAHGRGHTSVWPRTRRAAEGSPSVGVFLFRVTGWRMEDGAGGNPLTPLASLGPEIPTFLRREAPRGGLPAVSRPQGRRRIAPRRPPA